MSVLILILAFENIGSQCSSLNFFFYPVKSNPTVIFLGIAVLGIITGIFFHSLMGKMMGPVEDEEDQENL